MPGPELQSADLQHCLDLLKDLPKETSFLIMSGSLPPGVPEDFPAEIALIANDKGIKFIVDTLGTPLKKALEKGVFLIKPNLTELGTLVGKDWLDLSEIEEAAEQVLNNSKCEAIVASMGPAGALVITRQGKKQVNAPAVKKLSTVGAGDSMVAGIAWKLEAGESMEDAVRFGVACGTAATMNKETCALQHYIHLVLSPGNLSRIFLSIYFDLIAINNDGILCCFHILVETALGTAPGGCSAGVHRFLYR